MTVDLRTGTGTIGDTADLDSGGGTDGHGVVAIGVPGPGGHLVAGTLATPMRIDPTGDTVQPVGIVGGLPLPAGAATETTLATRASETTLATRASETTLASRASEATVAGLLTDAQLRATPVPVSSTSLPLPAGAATEVTLATRATEVTLATRASEATVAGLLTDTQLRATAVPVSGPLTDAELRATAVPVSAAALPLPAGAATEATLATRATETTLASRASEATVAGLLTDTQLRAAAVPVSAAALPLPAGAATEATLAGRLTDTELRATPVPVSGPLTDAELRAVAVPVSAAALPLPAGAATEATLASLEAKDFATQTTLEAARVLLASLDGKDFSTQTTLEAARVLLASISTAQTDGSQIAQSVGNVAHDAADSGAPVKVGGVATAAPPVAVTEGDRVDSSFDLLGRLRIADKPEIPAGSTAEGALAQGNVAGTTAVDTDFVVPDGETLTITKFLAGGEVDSRESKFELYHSIDAGVSDGTLLAFGYIGGGSSDVRRNLNSIILGSGTDVVIRLRRERLDNGTRELAASWEGHQT